jgi:HK97 family phage major capsid protein
MASTDQIREEIEALDAEIRSLHQTEEGELREFTPEQQTEFDAKRAERAAKLALLERHEAIEKQAALPERTERPSAPNVIVKERDTMEVFADRSASSTQIADALMRSVEGRLSDQPEAAAQFRSITRRHLRGNIKPDVREWAQNLAARSSDVYESAFFGYLRDGGVGWSNEERAAIAVGTNTAGGYLVPTHLDPSLILTNSGSSNVIRGLARNVTLAGGANTWHGVTTAGASFSVDGEIVEVSDDTPAVATVSIPTYKMQGFIQASIEATEDIVGLASDLGVLFADGRDRLEETQFTTGSGSSAPTGVFTAIAAVTASRVVSTTAAAIGLVDLHALYAAVPVRWRKRSDWLANPTYALAVKALGTAVSASYSGDLTQAPSGMLLGRPMHESDDAPTTQTTTALDSEILLGDFSQFVIVDKPGGMSVEYIPHLFNTANNLPDGRRGWYAHWRAGSDVVNTAAFRLLVDKTSA